MKTKLFSLLIAGMLILVSCQKNDDSNNNDNTPTADEVTEIAKNGNWRISSFIDSGVDETSDFTGYAFTFNTDGSVTAVKGDNTVAGTWSVTSGSSSSSSNDHFNIFFPVPESNDFEDLNDDWDITTANSTTISLIDISGGNGGTDVLIFKRN